MGGDATGRLGMHKGLGVGGVIVVRVRVIVVRVIIVRVIDTSSSVTRYQDGRWSSPRRRLPIPAHPFLHPLHPIHPLLGITG